MIQLANYEQRTFYIDLGEELTVVDLTLVFQMTDEHFLVRLVADKTNERATKFSYTATGLPEGQYLATFAKVDGTDLVTVAAFVTGDPIFATSQYNTYNDDGTSTTFVPSDDQGLVPSVSQRLRVKTDNDATDVHYVRTINVPDGSLTDDGNGEVTLDTSATGVTSLAELTDVTLNNLENHDVLKYNSGQTRWENVDWLLILYTELKQGTSTTQNNGSRTDSALELTVTQAKLKAGITGVEITETSPGDIDLIVATDAAGATAYTAINIDGSTTANEADINLYGKVYIHDVGNTTKAYIRLNSAGNVNLSLPTSSGTLALTDDIPSVPVDSVNGQTGIVVLVTTDIDEGTNLYYTEARVAANASVVANTLKVGITTQQAADITANNAKVGITSGQASEITANTAKVGITTSQAADIVTNTAKVGITQAQADDITANNAKTGITPTQASEITANTAKVSYTDAAVDSRIAAADIGDLADVPAVIGTTGQVLAVNTGATALEYVDQSGGGGGISFDYARAIMGSDVLQGGASQQNFDSATAQKVKFNTSADTEGTNITIDTTNNRITVGTTGYYVITSNISFYSGGARTTPATRFKVNGSTDLLGQGYGYIRAANGQNDNNNLITCIVELQANDYVEVFVGDSSSISSAVYATQAFFEISSTGGATGATGSQGPSGTTYDVVTLTGSTTLSSTHTTKYLVVNSSSSVDITVPASAAYDTYAEFVIEQRGTGVVTIVAASGVTINSSETLIAAGQYAVMGLKRTASNVYTLTGERIAS